jgi:hypothetical protein
VRLRNTTALLLALAAGLAAGCGGDEEEPEGEPIPADAAQQLEARLAEVERRFEFGGGACADIANDSEPAVESILASLPQNVDPDVRSALEQSFDRLFQLTSQDCDEQQGQDTEAEPEPPPETDTSIDTDTIPTETLPPETTEPPPPPEDDEGEETPPDEELPPVDPGQGDGGGVGVPGEDE